MLRCVASSDTTAPPTVAKMAGRAFANFGSPCRAWAGEPVCYDRWGCRRAPPSYIQGLGPPDAETEQFMYLGNRSYPLSAFPISLACWSPKLRSPVGSLLVD